MQQSAHIVQQSDNSRPGQFDTTLVLLVYSGILLRAATMLPALTSLSETSTALSPV